MKILLLTAILTLPLMGLAQDDLCTNHVKKVVKKDPKLEAILKKIDTASSKIRSYSANFKQTDTDPTFDEKEESSGKFMLLVKKLESQPDPYYFIRFDYEKPTKSITIINQSKIILYNDKMIKPQTSVMVNNLKLQALFAGFMSPKKLYENYDISIAKENNRVVILNFIPKTKMAKASFKSLRISFCKREWLPLGVMQNKVNGQNIFIQFVSAKVNQHLKPELFTLENVNELAKANRLKKKLRKKKL